MRKLTFALCFFGSALFSCEPRAWQPQSATHGEDHRSWTRSPPLPYTTTATPGGVQGGALAEELARRVRAHFRDVALQADGRLANLATRVVRLTQLRQRVPDALETDDIARQLGIVGPCPFVFLVPYTQEGWQEVDRLIAMVPGNLRFTHLGVAVIETSGTPQGAVAVGAQHLVLDPLPSQIAVDQKLTFKGKIAAEYREAKWVWTLPDGSTRPLAEAPDGEFSFTTAPLGAGIHRFEAFGVGPEGLEVLANFPVSAGSPRAAESDETAVDDSDPLAALLQLVNRARARAGAKPLARTPVLDRIALSHSTDMVERHFFGHDSPVTGTPDDRMRKSSVRLFLYGENVALAPSVLAAHRMLMQSPGHRQNILNPLFTHVGIGVVEKHAERPSSMSITQVFGRFPEPLADPAAFATALFEEMNRARSRHNLPPVSRQRALDAGARKIAARMAADPTIKGEHVDRLVRTSDFPRQRAAREIELLALFPAVPEDVVNVRHWLDPSLVSVGIGVVQAQATNDSPRTNVALFVFSR